MKFKQTILLFILLIATCLFSFSIFAQVPTAGLVAYWRLDGNVTDAGPNGIHGSLVGGASGTTNRFGTANSAVNFNNLSTTVSQIATHPVNSNLNFGNAQDFTVSVSFFLTSPWVHAGGIYENNMNYYGYGVWIWQSGGPTDYRIQFNFKNNSVASTPLPLNTWIHVICIRSGSALQIYINGVLNAAGVVGTQTPTYGFPGRWGAMFYDGLSPQNYNGLYGKVDETRIYNRALTLTEIVRLNAFVLPSKLGDFSATLEQQGVRLKWETLTEQNSSHFEIQRSADGTTFSSVGNVTATGDAGTRSLYSFSDQQPLNGNNFYRIKMVDKDGSFVYSRVLIVRNDKTLMTIRAFPNPVSDVLQVQLPSQQAGKVQLSIVDPLGKTVYTKWTEANTTLSIPVTALPKGFYNIVAVAGNQQQTTSFIKQ